jgi:hypothetical protein
MSCLLRAGIGSEEETVQDSTPHAFGHGSRFGVYEIDRHADGRLCVLGRGAMGVTYRATDTSQLYDINGNPVGPLGCTNEAGTRFE